MTLTYYATTTIEATGIHVATRERLADASAPADATDNLGSVSAGASALMAAWTTASGAPNTSDWGSGTYTARFSVNAVGADITYGARTVGTANGHFARVDSGLTADQETATQAEAAFSGTGVNNGTVTWDPAAGSTGDRFEVLLAATNAGSMNQSLTVNVGATHTTISGPIDGAVAARTPQRTTTGVGT